MVNNLLNNPTHRRTTLNIYQVHSTNSRDIDMGPANCNENSQRLPESSLSRQPPLQNWEAEASAAQVHDE